MYLLEEDFVICMVDPPEVTCIGEERDRCLFPQEFSGGLRKDKSTPLDGIGVSSVL